MSWLSFHNIVWWSLIAHIWAHGWGFSIAIFIPLLWKSGGYTGFALSFCHSVIPSFRNLSNENFSSHFSQKLWGIEGWNLVHTWTVGGWIVYTGIRLLLLFIPLFLHFFFLSNFQTLKIFVTLFSGTVRPRRLKLGIHMDNGWMYRVYRNQAAAAYLSLYFFIFLSNFQHYKFSSHFSQELWGLEGWNLVHTWTMFRCIVYTRIRLLLLIHPIYSFFFLSNFQTLKFFVTLFSGTVRPRRLKLGTHVDCGQMYHVYRNQTAAAYLSLYSLFFTLDHFNILHPWYRHIEDMHEEAWCWKIFFDKMTVFWT